MEIRLELTRKVAGDIAGEIPLEKNIRMPRGRNQEMMVPFCHLPEVLMGEVTAAMPLTL